MPKDRTYPENPLVGVSAAIWHDDRVLLVERAKDPLKGFWSLPGGLVHTGEPLEEAVRREIAEETGITVDIRGIADVAEIIRPDDAGKFALHYVIIVFAGYWRAGKVLAQDDAADAGWYTSRELSELTMTEGTERIIGKTKAFLDKN